MEDLFARVAGYCALVIEAIAVLVIVYGAVRVLFSAPVLLTEGPGTYPAKREVWIHFARWLLLGLEFTLAADIVRTTISPTWNDLGQLATIAAIRTGLNYFLERDIREIEEARVPVERTREGLDQPRRPRAAP